LLLKDGENGIKDDWDLTDDLLRPYKLAFAGDTKYNAYQLFGDRIFRAPQ
jgi:hypothetical protein